MVSLVRLLLASQLALVVTFSLYSLVSALRYDQQDNVTIVNTGCKVPSFVNGFCVDPYLTWDASNNFSLGFVMHESQPDAYTLSIYWRLFGAIEDIEVVWSANRNSPVKLGAWFTFLANGSLILYDSNGAAVWSTNTDKLGAVGLDLDTTQGNLILYGNNNETVWQSFDYPTDTLLQGQTLQWGMSLVSNASTSGYDGSYSLVMEPGGPVLYASFPDPRPYWLWGYYFGQTDNVTVSSLSKTCDNPVMLQLLQPGYIILDKNLNMSLSEEYKSPALCNLTSADPNGLFTSSFATGDNLTRFMKLENDGSLKVYVYSGGLKEDYNFFPPDKQCNLPERCGQLGVCKSTGQCSCPSPSVSDGHRFEPENPNDPQQGCYYSGSGEETVCQGLNHHMLQLDGVDYYWNRYTGASNKTAIDECESLCLNNCSCLASFYNIDTNACLSVFQSESLLTLRSSQDTNLKAFIKVNGPVSTGKKKSRNWVGVVIGCVVSLLFVLGLISGVMICRSKRKGRLARKSEEDAFLGTLPGLPPRFSVKELDAATMGFTKKLGSGGFGTVYEGTLPDGTKIAVKKLESTKGTKDFRAEMATLGSIHHVNLVRLRGFCAEGLDCMLVYEYMPKGSLDRWLFSCENESRSAIAEPLDWGVRFKIAVGTARGLAYLHEECTERIIHLDIKPQNILLDDNFLPKVADFGLSKLVDREMSLVVTTMRGTPGYLAPEWLLQAAVTERSDVYSYGMVLLELLAGRKCLDLSNPVPEKRYLPVWALHCLQGGTAQDILDKRLQYLDKYNIEQVAVVLRIALLCIQEEMMRRPSMGNVVQMLEGLVQVPDIERDKNLSTRYRFASVSGSGTLSLSSNSMESDNFLSDSYRQVSTVSLSQGR